MYFIQVQYFLSLTANSHGTDRDSDPEPKKQHLYSILTITTLFTDKQSFPLSDMAKGLHRLNDMIWLIDLCTFVLFTSKDLCVFQTLTKKDL